jgi:hypothetical protein
LSFVPESTSMLFWVIFLNSNNKKHTFLWQLSLWLHPAGFVIWKTSCEKTYCAKSQNCAMSAGRQDIQSYHLFIAVIGEVNLKHAFVRDTVSEQQVTKASSCSVCVMQFTLRSLLTDLQRAYSEHVWL